MKRQTRKLQEELQFMEEQLSLASEHPDSQKVIVENLMRHQESKRKSKRPELQRELHHKQEELSELRRAWWQSHGGRGRGSKQPPDPHEVFKDVHGALADPRGSSSASMGSSASVQAHDQERAG
mmetsp:Transcript_85769/g.266612  ORF Transcript_85769/g.266612 Transcript_85769/m.266612 type:complete len:124 (-) Transcript_85769:74-445(-)